MLCLGLDPGGTTGVALLLNGRLLDCEEVKGDVEGIWKFLRSADIPDVIVCEDFGLRPEMAKRLIWNSLPAVRVIGAIQFWALETGIPFILQSPSIKPIGYKWLGIPNKHKHLEDAHVHAYYYCVKNGIVDVTKSVRKDIAV